MFITSTPSFGKSLLIILPKAEAAAVMTTHFYFLCFNKSNIPRAVKGLITDIAPCSKLVSSVNGRHSSHLAIIYWAYDPCPYFSAPKATFLFTKPHPITPPPFSTTIPEP